ncbi:bactofilin family protein [Xylella fastidiosa subsp. sandyi]|uniref:bactofilin family protein n=1 Tax=Xylella fastidiosa TaxID=2371 RepID=UPI0007074C17|nr:polymer-forming cytoskeletal protein [Xylella fastidiosa]KQH74306.1 cell shape determination protein CcmA [Xylella fastidiosa]RWA44454.1 cell shape determination protein CcmA [Xylella fastidiosa subsp. sandyi]WNY18693.1 polymer-forming cytoskeletal protein [Xylella fastidiosa]WNY20980.1 polymer-forming cytoskeletal protein [Xylella fastidiosa]
MFGNKSNRSDRNVVDTLIGPQAVITGDISFSGVLYVEGNIFGKVIADEGVSATLVVAEKGRIDGEVRAPVIVINGRLDGDVYAADRVELGGGACVHGNVHYKVVEMRVGAQLTGSLIHTNNQAALPPPDEPLSTLELDTSVAAGP